ncbi:TetR/AcrR family transcriptional regulator [Amycolatopsis suaedae]|uniref:TetR/AcrR family transcriptional regulator n=1 Tax=Amycolatopsis suaedae TaxID=2510978 RepID=A0A4Q7J5U6_9PSEU|nr:TetR/AcrR family transcriptional regulator [Amycolatopsis suaedae]RZQ62489.1 TetR/AcrR family transcriptional regulator [Amycolatopsis suaedae]
MAERRRSEATRQAILDAALELAGEVGYAKLSVEGIAARAGAGKQTIYRWWPSKGAVLLDALLAYTTGPSGRIDDVELPDTGDLSADLKAVLRATVEELNDPRLSAPMRALSTEILADPVLAADYADRLETPVRELKLRRLRRAVDAGEVSADADLDVVVDLLWGPLRTRWLYREGPLTKRYTDRVVDTVLNGIRRW